jgi:hypothetical protein
LSLGIKIYSDEKNITDLKNHSIIYFFTI